MTPDDVTTLYGDGGLSEAPRRVADAVFFWTIFNAGTEDEEDMLIKLKLNTMNY